MPVCDSMRARCRGARRVTILEPFRVAARAAQVVARGRVVLNTCDGE